MRLALFLAALLSFRHAHAEIRFRSTGREVTVDLQVDGKRHECTTPCVLDVPPGDYRARIDGLDRQLGGNDNEVVIAPTRHGRLITGAVLVGVFSVGLTFAGHWASPLDNRQRLSVGLLGGAALGFAMAFISTASARIGRASPAQADVFAGVHHVAAEPMAVVGVGFRPGAWGLGAELHTRYTTDPDHYQFVAGPTLHFPKLPLVRPALAAHIGLASMHGPTVVADPPIPGELELRTVLDVQARLELTNPGRFQPSIGLTLQVLPVETHAIDVGVHVRF